MSLKERFIAWVNADPRCPWRAPLTGERCVRGEGHPRACITETVYGQSRSWYGINYTDDGKYQRHRRTEA